MASFQELKQEFHKIKPIRAVYDDRLKVLAKISLPDYGLLKMSLSFSKYSNGEIYGKIVVDMFNTIFYCSSQSGNKYWSISELTAENAMKTIEKSVSNIVYSKLTLKKITVEQFNAIMDSIMNQLDYNYPDKEKLLKSFHRYSVYKTAYDNRISRIDNISRMASDAWTDEYMNVGNKVYVNSGKEIGLQDDMEYTIVGKNLGGLTLKSKNGRVVFIKNEFRHYLNPLKSFVEDLYD